MQSFKLNKEEEGTTKKCGECLADIPKGAKKCSQCGSKQKRKYGKKHLLIGLALLFGFFLLVGLSGDSSNPSSTVERRENNQQIATTQQGSQNEQTQNQQETTNTNDSQETQMAEEENATPQATAPTIASFGNGTHIVGTDIEPRTYRSQGTNTCYWARLSGFGGQLDDVTANGNSSPEIVTITSSDAAFETSGCGEWVAVEDTYPTTPATSFSDGTYEVGRHIASGTYRANGSPDDFCYWARLSSFSQAGTSNVITNGNSPTVIEISSNDKGFTAFGCGNWTRI